MKIESASPQIPEKRPASPHSSPVFRYALRRSASLAMVTGISSDVGLPAVHPRRLGDADHRTHHARELQHDAAPARRSRARQSCGLHRDDASGAVPARRCAQRLCFVVAIGACRMRLATIAYRFTGVRSVHQALLHPSRHRATQPTTSVRFSASSTRCSARVTRLGLQLCVPGVGMAQRAALHQGPDDRRPRLCNSGANAQAVRPGDPVGARKRAHDMPRRCAPRCSNLIDEPHLDKRAFVRTQ